MAPAVNTLIGGAPPANGAPPRPELANAQTARMGELGNSPLVLALMVLAAVGILAALDLAGFKSTIAVGNT